MSTFHNTSTDNERSNDAVLQAYREAFEEIQILIDTGEVWHLEGRLGRMAINGIRRGFLHLGPESFEDAYGNRVPACHEVKPGTQGSREFCRKFWRKELRAEMPW